MFNRKLTHKQDVSKKSGLSYESVRERYEHFRARCTIDIDKKQNL